MAATTSPSVAVVTGAASGMGRACVDALRDAVDVVVGADLEPPEIGNVVGVACDVSDAASIDALVVAAAAIGSVTALVHAAGISPTMDQARRILEVNLVGTEMLLRGFEPSLSAGAAVVCFSSSAAYAVAPYVTGEVEALLDDPLAATFLDEAVTASGGDSGLAYAFAKVGVIRAAARAAVRCGPLGVRVNSVAPGIIDTPMGRQELEQQPVMRDMLGQTPLGRVGTADEVAAVVAFLVSGAASYLTGVDVLVDGGQLQGTKSAKG